MVQGRKSWPTHTRCPLAALQLFLALVLVLLHATPIVIAGSWLSAELFFAWWLLAVKVPRCLGTSNQRGAPPQQQQQQWQQHAPGTTTASGSSLGEACTHLVQQAWDLLSRLLDESEGAPLLSTPQHLLDWFVPTGRRGAAAAAPQLSLSTLSPHHVADLLDYLLLHGNARCEDKALLCMLLLRIPAAARPLLWLSAAMTMHLGGGGS